LLKLHLRDARKGLDAASVEIGSPRILTLLDKLAAEAPNFLEVGNLGLVRGLLWALWVSLNLTNLHF